MVGREESESIVRSARRAVKEGVFRAITRLMGDAEGRTALPVLRGPARGLRLSLDLLGESSYLFNRYDPQITRRLVKICRPGWTVWDCGTYLGYYTLLFARLVGPEGCVVSFEPDPRNLARTRENVRRNRLQNVRFVHAAIGSPQRDMEFIVSENTNSHIAGTYVGATPESYAGIERRDATIRVECLGLDQAYMRDGIPAPQLVKRDIEGAEQYALRHAERLVPGVRPLILVELHNPDCDAAAWEFSRTYGYALFDILDGREFHSAGEVHGTILCCPAESARGRWW